MALIRWKNDVFEPWSEFERLQDDINQLFNVSRDSGYQGLFDRTMSPPVDAVESDEDFKVLCDLPGVKRENLEVSVSKGILTIKGEKKTETKTEKRKVFKKETWEGSFQRTLSLPGDADTEKVTAELKDGILTVTLPKKEEIKPKQISVQAH